MKIVTIEPTPSPYSMKIVVDDMLPMGSSFDYKRETYSSGDPDYVQALFQIEGVKGIYRVADFLALERSPKSAWETILPAVRGAFGENSQGAPAEVGIQEPHYGQVDVQVQTIYGVPMQIKLLFDEQEKRIGLPALFTEAAMDAAGDDNIVFARKWEEQYPRYGDPDQVGQDIYEELLASYSSERLRELVARARNPQAPAAKRQQPTMDVWNEDDWRVRYRALDALEPGIAYLPFLDKALQDPKASIRRLATAYLGMIEDKAVLPLLYLALRDKVVTVRRTAGDCLSDLGFKEATPAMEATLADPSRIVRWRAAMFLYEIGDSESLPLLEKAARQETEFEVKLQLNMAIERIAGGEAAKGSVWKQMTEATKQKEE
ncbi:conserved virulence factor C family protein [Terribacillus saccharophilus]|uniref:Virulence factor n=1 Tax=Terribacillus saccharophilus TaxID=361277 RepID=A0ABX4H010_9BACI|nr:conserved virulence factor C family protein [Terribacillus saccharophilus]PAD36055.1 virulence factor [Terribacillus saccharophilus]PAD96895.1 virulence factor [Terribacillus saccharophilus]PAE00471.1 virulence factor [Terribacillus saccharophilus]